MGALATLVLAPPALTQEVGDEVNNDEVFQVKAVIQVPGATFFSFDISWTDPVLNKYFLTDRNNLAIDVVDMTTLAITQFKGPAYAGFTGNNDTSGPDGVLVANDHTELWVGDSPGKVWVLDSSSGAVKSLPSPATNPILVGGTTRADELCYDPQNNVIMIASPGEDPPFVTFISTAGPKAYQVLGKLPFDGTGGTPKATNGIEQCQWKPGKFYINTPEVNGPGNDTSPGEVTVIDPVTMKVVAHLPVPIDVCGGPQGLTVGPNNQILLGCNAKSPDGHRNSVIIDASSGAVVSVLNDLGGADAVWFNPGDNHYIIPSCNTPCRTVPTPGAITGNELLGLVDATLGAPRLDQFVVVAQQNSDTNVTSGNPRTIHSVAADPVSNQIFLPIPACVSATSCGNVPHFTPSLCDASGLFVGRIGSPSSATGCIAVLATKQAIFGFSGISSSFAKERGSE